MWALNTCGEPNETELTIRVLTGCFTALFPIQAAMAMTSPQQRGRAESFSGFGKVDEVDGAGEARVVGRPIFSTQWGSIFDFATP